MASLFPPPRALSPSLEMSLCSRDDIEDQLCVYYEALSPDPRNTFWWPEDKEALFEAMRPRFVKAIDNPLMRNYKISDAETGELVAFARWDVPKSGMKGLPLPPSIPPTQSQTDNDEAEKERDEVEKKTSVPGDPAKTQDQLKREAFEDFVKVVMELRGKRGAQDMLCLSLLCTSPKYERRGAASALLRSALSAADAEGITAYLESTRIGQRLYEKLGYEVVDTIHADTSKTGPQKFDGPHTMAVMIRRPGSSIAS